MTARLSPFPVPTRREGNIATAPTWDGPEYGVLPPGVYDAVATRTQGPQWIRRFRRWGVMVEFQPLCESKRVCAFFNLGSNPNKPHAGPQSRYFAAWSIANGERPRPKQKLEPRVFMDGQLFKVVVEDCRTDSEGQQKDPALTYSQVKTILSANLHNQVNQHNHPNHLSMKQ